MKADRQSTFHVPHFGLGLLTLLLTIHFNLSTFAQITVFTYQGRLIDTNNIPANGLYDFRFTVYVSENNPGSVAGPILLPATPVTNGLFTVTLDFGGAYPFPGFDRWLGIEVRTNGSGPFTALSPRQEVTPTPYAITAQNVLSGGQFGTPVNFNNPANSFSGNGGGLTNVNAGTLGGYGYCSLPCYWNLAGNAGTSPGLNFVGTSDNQPLSLKVNNTTALQIVPGTSLPNVVGGRGAFRPSILASGVSGVVIAGGGAPSGGFTGFGAGDFMAAYDDDGAIGGGFGNKVGTDNGDPTDAAFATVGGGIFNGAANFAATVGGGAANTASGTRSVVAGGNGNTATADYSSVGGGAANTIQTSAVSGTVGGGTNNTVSGAKAVVSGGDSNVGGSGYATVSGGGFNQASGWASVVCGGGGRDLAGGGPYPNVAGGSWSVVSGGESNTASGYGSAIGGGAVNQATNSYATVPGGVNNTAGGLFSFATGRKAAALHQGSFVWADSQAVDFLSTANDQFSVRAQGGVRFTSGGGSANTTVSWTPGSASWSFSSDRNLKEGFEKVDTGSVLDKVAHLPISEWSYCGYSQRHIGPMAQDFHAQFPLNESDTTLNDADLHGVALAAIQGLNEKVESENASLCAQLNRQQAENAELKQRLERLEKLMLNKSPN